MEQSTNSVRIEAIKMHAIDTLAATPLEVASHDRLFLIDLITNLQDVLMRIASDKNSPAEKLREIAQEGMIEHG